MNPRQRNPFQILTPGLYIWGLTLISHLKISQPESISHSAQFTEARSVCLSVRAALHFIAMRRGRISSNIALVEN